MRHRYHLHVRLKGRDIVQLDGTNLKEARYHALLLASDYLRAYPPDEAIMRENFRVFDDDGRLLMEFPVSMLLEQGSTLARNASRQ